MGEGWWQRGGGLNKKQRDHTGRGRKMQSYSSDTEEMLAGEPAEGTSQPLLKVSLPLCRGDNLEDQSLAAEPVWMKVRNTSSFPFKEQREPQSNHMELQRSLPTPSVSWEPDPRKGIVRHSFAFFLSTWNELHVLEGGSKIPVLKQETCEAY